MALTPNRMNTRLKADVEEAIQNVLNANCDSDTTEWNHYIHPTLVSQMANAAALVFDSAQDAQDYFEKETS
jgi:hypothetical protein